jgi:hypothetical protein
VSYMTVPPAVVARIRADALEEGARMLDHENKRGAAARLREYLAPYRADAARGSGALTVSTYTYRVPLRGVA